jgi:hypothetical protein
MSVEYKVGDNVVTQEQYAALEAQLENKQHHMCIELTDGGKSTSIATHKTNGKKYKITYTQRGTNKAYHIIEAEPAL